jgi:hypothetical protein
VQEFAAAAASEPAGQLMHVPEVTAAALKYLFAGQFTAAVRETPWI